MARQFSGHSLVIASHNAGKIREIRELLGHLVTEMPSGGELGLAEPDETGLSYVENAELKARAAATVAGLPALADDSGLSVAALGGAPGIYSARWAGPNKDFAIAMQAVEDALAKIARDTGIAPARQASFICALSLAWPDGHCETVEGVVHGTLTWPPRGAGGFGYDPMFVPDGHTLTFGEVDQGWKHTVSHRADAFAKLERQVFAGRGAR